MFQTVAEFPEVIPKILQKNINSLLESSSEVSFVNLAYFEKYVLPMIRQIEIVKSDVQKSFALTVANTLVMPCVAYPEQEIVLLGFHVPQVAFLIAKNSREVMGHHWTDKVPGVVRCNFS